MTKEREIELLEDFLKYVKDRMYLGKHFSVEGLYSHWRCYMFIKKFPEHHEIDILPKRKRGILRRKFIKALIKSNIL